MNNEKKAKNQKYDKIIKLQKINIKNKAKYRTCQSLIVNHPGIADCRVALHQSEDLRGDKHF